MLRYRMIGLICLVLLSMLCVGCSEKTAVSAPDPLPDSASDAEAGDTAVLSPSPLPEDPPPETQEPSPLPDLDGAWEPQGYAGPRVEIRGNELVRLWFNSPVLEATFTVKEEDGRFVLTLSDPGLRNTPSEEAYATVTACWYKDGALTFVDEFPYSGERTETLYPTDNSRYGDVTVVDDTMLPQLEGEWTDGDLDLILVFRGSTMLYGYSDLMIGETEIITVRHNRTGEIRIVDADPAVIDSVGMFGPLRWGDGVIFTYIPIADAAPAEIIFHKTENGRPAGFDGEEAGS